MLRKGRMNSLRAGGFWMIRPHRRRRQRLGAVGGWAAISREGLVVLGMLLKSPCDSGRDHQGRLSPPGAVTRAVPVVSTSGVSESGDGQGSLAKSFQIPTCGFRPSWIQVIRVTGGRGQDRGGSACKFFSDSHFCLTVPRRCRRILLRI